MVSIQNITWQDDQTIRFYATADLTTWNWYAYDLAADEMTLLDMESATPVSP